MSDLASTIEALKGFFAKELLDGDASGLDEGTNLLEAGLINSQALVKLTTFIIDTWAIRIPFKHLTPVNMKNLHTIAELIARLRTPPPSP